MSGLPINEGDIEIQLVDNDGEDVVNADTNGTEEGDRLEHFYTALNWVKQELVSVFLYNMDINIMGCSPPLTCM